MKRKELKYQYTDVEEAKKHAQEVRNGYLLVTRLGHIKWTYDYTALYVWMIDLPGTSHYEYYPATQQGYEDALRRFNQHIDFWLSTLEQDFYEEG